MDEERKDACYGRVLVCMHWEREGVSIWKGSSVRAWREGGCVHMEGAPSIYTPSSPKLFFTNLRVDNFLLSGQNVACRRGFVLQSDWYRQT